MNYIAPSKFTFVSYITESKDIKIIYSMLQKKYNQTEIARVIYKKSVVSREVCYNADT